MIGKLKIVLFAILLSGFFIICAMVLTIKFTLCFIIRYLLGFVVFTYRKVISFGYNLWQSIKTLFLGFVALLASIFKK